MCTDEVKLQPPTTYFRDTLLHRKDSHASDDIRWHVAPEVGEHISQSGGDLAEHSFLVIPQFHAAE